MDPERWNRINEVVGEALRRPVEERAAWLDRVCPEADMRQEVEALLAEETGLLSALDHPPFPLLESSPEPDAGARIGPYRLVRELGRGGMGVVYLAERADEEFQRQVALKVLKRGLDTLEIVRRFRTERQILANLKHPGIAELFEGGSTESGLPYFAMEYIQGERIDRFCEERRLSVRGRLELFLEVCDAVQFAHQNLVVHRDLKPANILVTADGEPKLLDFGIAKLLDPHTREPVTETRLGFRPMTPEYASPEQVMAAPVTTATDVYSLGAVLYELLTGRRPFHRTPRTSPEELRRAICEDEPEKPSTVVTRPADAPSTTPSAGPGGGGDGSGQVEEARRLGRRLKGDLDNIVLVALAKDPADRYASVEQLAEDIRRHLTGLPVRARRPTLPYRLGKFLRRNASKVAAGILMLAVAAGLLFDREIQQRQTARQRDRAETVTRFLVELFEVADPGEARGNTVTAREILDRGTERIRQELEEQPDVRAALMKTMGEVYQRLGLYDEASPLLEEALSLRRRLHGDLHPEVAQSLGDLAELRLLQREEVEQVEELYREVLAIYRRTVGPEHPDIALTLNNLAVVLRMRGKTDEAEGLFLKALAMQRKILGEGHIDVAKTLNNLAVLLQNDRRDLDAAEPLFREALSIKRRSLGGDHPDVALGLSNLALVLQAKGELEQAEELYQESLAIFRGSYGPEHPRIARILTNLGVLNQDRGDLEAAETFLREALAIRRKYLAPAHPDIARAITRLAQVVTARGRYGEAESLVREALEIFRQHRSERGHDVRYLTGFLGSLLEIQGRHEEAEEMFLSCFEASRAAGDERQARSALERLISLSAARDQPEKVAEYRSLMAPP